MPSAQRVVLGDSISPMRAKFQSTPRFDLIPVAARRARLRMASAPPRRPSTTAD
jgi:hypothetical protein